MDDQAYITRSDPESKLLDEASEPKALPLSLLAEITNGFSDKHESDRSGFTVDNKVCTD